MRVILVERRKRGEASTLQELAALARTLEHEVVGMIEQIGEPDPAYHIGKGKAEELARLVKALKAERVIFANQLTPSQAFKLSTLAGVEVIDRFQLILEIFAMRAGSPEAKLQVEYARLSYELPRVRERVRSLLSVEQPGFRGGGEYEANVYYDMIKRRMAHLRRRLASVAKAREQRRKLRRRRGFKLVALAGYTNAGKSTLLNTLTSANVEVDDMLFTTLTPRTRATKASRKILLTDTVGFIDGLPPWMVEAFKATLEEIYSADLVVLILDIAEPMEEILRKLRASREILKEYPVKVITAINKIDKLPPAEVERRVKMLQVMPGEIVPISAMRGENIQQLMEAIRNNVWRR
jgi:GTP-binding protein HflX